VGLDPEPERFAPSLQGLPDAIFQFNRRIVDATADYACCYKPQFAHYAALGAEDQLLATIRYIHERHPGLPVILDSKRGDIGNTAGKYAQEAFVRYGADAVTVDPYMGLDTLEPYLKWTDRGVIILCRTSNPGARDFQDLQIEGKRLYRIVAEQVATRCNTAGNCLLVVGAIIRASLPRSARQPAT
jgi:orotidine-5'-phosphate decarboxylase